MIADAAEKVDRNSPYSRMIPRRMIVSVSRRAFVGDFAEYRTRLGEMLYPFVRLQFVGEQTPRRHDDYVPVGN